MKLTTYVFVTFLTAFLLVYWAIPTVTTNRTEHIFWTRGKLYLALFAGSTMSLLEVVLHDIYHDTVSIFHLLLFGFLLFGSAHFYRTQQHIDEKDFIQQMTEAAHKDLLISRALLEHSMNMNVLTAATNIIDRRVRDINVFTKLLADMEKTPKLPITNFTMTQPTIIHNA